MDTLKYLRWNKHCIYGENDMTLDKKDYAKFLPEVKPLINKVVQKNMADSMLFSAGTDTSIIAYEAVKYKPEIPCLTLAFKHGNPKDTEYVKTMVAFLKLNQETHVFDKDEVLQRIVGTVASRQRLDRALVDGGPREEMAEATDNGAVTAGNQPLACS